MTKKAFLPPINATPEDIASALFKVQRPDSRIAWATDFRNKQWETCDAIPSWVDISQVQLDRFFTRPEVALQCHASLLNAMKSDNAITDEYCFVEPGAGNGAFYRLLPENRRLGIDLVQSDLEYVVSDFLTWQPKANGRRYAVVGNPPFGYRGWLALAFMNHAASFADYIGMILPMSFQSDGKGSPRNRVIGAEIVIQEELPTDAFITATGQSVKLNALWQVWRRGINNRTPDKTCDNWVDLFTVDVRKERLCGHERLHEADWLLQRTFFGEPPHLVKTLEDVKYGCGYGIVVKKSRERIKQVLNRVDWRKYSNLAMHNCRHISMYHIRNALTDAGFVDV